MSPLDFELQLDQQAIEQLRAVAIAAVRNARARVLSRIQYAGDELADVLSLVRRCAHELGDFDLIVRLRVGPRSACDSACLRAWLAVDAWRRAQSRER